MTNKVRDALLGVAVGDAIGVPYEFLNRTSMKKNPCTDMVGYGTHDQPPGTWSDDSSLTFCLADSLCDGYNLEDIGKKFVQWRSEGLWTPHGQVFDIGMTTVKSIVNISQGGSARGAGAVSEGSNGNGSLMRIIPLTFILDKENDIKTRFEKIKEVSSITHGHFRSYFSCFIYVEMCILLLKGKSKRDSYMEMKSSVKKFIKENDFKTEEVSLFDRILNSDISSVDEKKIYSSGYVLHSLEASIWCFLTSNSYKEGVLKAVNLGEDTDTTAAISGGLLGLFYGVNNIPEEWSENISRYDDVIDLCDLLNDSL